MTDVVWIVAGAAGWLAAAALGWSCWRMRRRGVAALGEAEQARQAAEARDAASLERERFGKELSVALQPCRTLKDFGDVLLLALCRRLQAHAGAFHVLDAADGRYALAAGYAAGESPAFTQRFAPGEGLAGQAAQDRRAVVVRAQAGDWIGVGSGTVVGAAVGVVVAPVVVRDEVPAVLELALMREVGARDRLLLDEVLPLAALHLQTLRAQLATLAEFERSRAIEALQRRILAKISDGIFGQDAEGRVTFANAAALRMLGFEEADLVGQPMHALTHHHHPDGREFPREDCPIYRTLHDGQTRTVTDEVFWRKDGTPLAVEYSVSAVDAGSGTQGVVISFRDITERQRAEQQLRQRSVELQASEARLRQLFETANEGIWIVDTERRTRDLNPEMARILGRRREDVLGRDILDFVDEANAAIFQEQMRRRAQGRLGAYEISLSRPHGAQVPCLFNASPLVDAEGRRVGSFAMVSDLSRLGHRDGASS